jgi:predicted HTH domain antitoxin
MSSVTLELDEDLVTVLREENESVPRAALESIVMDLYRRAVISGGKGAQLLGLSRLEFIHRAADFGIPYFNWDEEDWETELKFVRKYSRQ